MTELLGWIRAEETAMTPYGVQVVIDGKVARVVSPDADIRPRQRLEAIQSLFHACRSVLPYASGLEDAKPAVIRERLEGLAGHGQLRLQMTAPRRSVSAPSASGRAYLDARRKERRGEAAWRDTAESALIAISAQFSVRERKTHCRDGRLTHDLLVPNEPYLDLRQRLDAAIASSSFARNMPGALAISGLWAPMSFAAQSVVDSCG